MAAGCGSRGIRSSGSRRNVARAERRHGRQRGNGAAPRRAMAHASSSPSRGRSYEVRFGHPRAAQSGGARRLRSSGARDAVQPAEHRSPGSSSLWSASRPAGETLNAIEDFERLGCGGLLSLVQSFGQSSEANPPRLWIVTRGAQAVNAPGASPAHASVWGLARTIAAEYPDLKSVCVDLGDSPTNATERRSGARLPRPMAKVRLPSGRGNVMSLVSREARRERPRRLRRSASDRPMQLVITSRGILDNLQLQPVERRPPGPGEVEVRVAATGLNFRDVLNALGMYPGDPGPLGNECAGTVSGARSGCHRSEDRRRRRGPGRGHVQHVRDDRCGVRRCQAVQSDRRGSGDDRQSPS